MRLGLPPDGQQGAQLLGYYCATHGCHKCRTRSNSTMCSRCKCHAQGCTNNSSLTYLNSPYCTNHTCPICHVRLKSGSTGRCRYC
jgi:hypothetical protein